MHRLSTYRTICFLLLCITASQAQVYTYDPVRHTNFETNPSYLASGRYNGMVSWLHQGNTVLSKKFACDELKYAVYDKRHFYGLGLVLNNTQVNDTVSYRYAGIGAAYRNVLFNVIHTRIGFLYKLNQFTGAPGQLTDYSVYPTGNSDRNISGSQNANAALSFASARDTWFASFSILNLQLHGARADYLGVSPAYYVANIGDLAKIFGAQHTNISFTATMRINSSEHLLSYFVHIRQDGIALSRKTLFVYALTAGYCGSQFLQFKPSLSLYHGKRFRGYHRRSGFAEKGSVAILYDFAVPLGNNPGPYKPSLQFSLAHFF